MELTDKQKRQLMHYIKERRHNGRVILGIVVFAALLTTVPGIQDFSHLSDHGMTGGSDGDTGLLWIVCLLAAVALIIRGWGRTLGPGNDLDCIEKGNYMCGESTCRDKGAATEKPPCILSDADGEMECVVFPDFRNAKRGDRLLWVQVKSGKRYCFRINEDEEW